jgi:prepilin-type N-terminal cleavage/methylation domain-containing protein
MKRAGFTMIELIFVIVILGILSAVALPKFIGVSEQANVSKLKAYVGSLNRTVAPTLWSQSLTLGDNGSIQGTGHDNTYYNDAKASIEDLENVDDGGLDIGLTAMTSLGSCTLAPGAVDAVNVGDSIAAGLMQSVTVGGKSYSIGCINGNASTAPRFFLTGQPDGSTEVLLVK